MINLNSNSSPMNISFVPDETQTERKDFASKLQKIENRLPIHARERLRACFNDRTSRLDLSHCQLNLLFENERDLQSVGKLRDLLSMLTWIEELDLSGNELNQKSVCELTPNLGPSCKIVLKPENMEAISVTQKHDRSIPIDSLSLPKKPIGEKFGAYLHSVLHDNFTNGELVVLRKISQNYRKNLVPLCAASKLLDSSKAVKSLSDVKERLAEIATFKPERYRGIPLTALAEQLHCLGLADIEPAYDAIFEAAKNLPKRHATAPLAFLAVFLQHFGWSKADRASKFFALFKAACGLPTVDRLVILEKLARIMRRPCSSTDKRNFSGETQKIAFDAICKQVGKTSRRIRSKALYALIGAVKNSAQLDTILDLIRLQLPSECGALLKKIQKTEHRSYAGICAPFFQSIKLPGTPPETKAFLCRSLAEVALFLLQSKSGAGLELFDAIYDQAEKLDLLKGDILEPLFKMAMHIPLTHRGEAIRRLAGHLSSGAMHSKSTYFHAARTIFESAWWGLDIPDMHEKLLDLVLDNRKRFSKPSDCDEAIRLALYQFETDDYPKNKDIREYQQWYSGLLKLLIQNSPS
ncbi:MAG TPA: hypothetical protein VEC06_13260 [Paucimonas sp.]|nr:hypothetical protein [Paucimonas sp.]